MQSRPYGKQRYLAVKYCQTANICCTIEKKLKEKLNLEVASFAGWYVFCNFFLFLMRLFLLYLILYFSVFSASHLGFLVILRVSISLNIWSCLKLCLFEPIDVLFNLFGLWFFSVPLSSLGKGVLSFFFPRWEVSVCPVVHSGPNGWYNCTCILLC